MAQVGETPTAGKASAGRAGQSRANKLPRVGTDMVGTGASGSARKLRALMVMTGAPAGSLACRV
ncbi:hypothetical protein MSIMFB_03231 [Mycobacterium simulans]|uniref:Uncharacterized protein n=1 Tax=Mycobacterium simulans TaxID=627089 RepID=A0A7Z7IN71_9MYCO|nr:hypothetical protein MSIMFB_03231 [Mycobacterium simulans]